MEEFVSVTKEEWDMFIEWYQAVMSGCEVESQPIADLVKIKNRNGEVIGQKTWGGNPVVDIFKIRKQEYLLSPLS
jgi:hypothetical protein